MPACGGQAPFPMRMGGGKPRLAHVLESLNAGRGGSVDTSEGTVAYAENMAHARAITAAWHQNERLGNQWTPELMTDCLPRWEAICGIVPSPDDSLVARRERISKLFARIGLLINRATLEQLLRAEIGPVFVAVENITVDNAVVHSPDPTYDFGTQAEGAPWSSTVLHVLVRLQKPAGYTEGDFYEAAGKVAAVLDATLPAWCTFDWYRAPTGGAPISVYGGPSAAGFYLDQEANLDNHVLDT